MNISNYYQTFDLQLASYLLAKGLRLSEINFTYNKRAEFKFEAPEFIDTLICQFWDDEPNIGPKTLLTAQKSLKQRLYESEYQNRVK